MNITQEMAADIYHAHLDDAHMVLEDFSSHSRKESHNKMNLLWNKLHMASGAKYIYSEHGAENFSAEWLGSKGKHVIDELINDAKKSKMTNALKTLKELRKILEEKNLIN